jgi:hypothetical protein
MQALTKESFGSAERFLCFFKMNNLRTANMAEAQQIEHDDEAAVATLWPP